MIRKVDLVVDRLTWPKPPQLPSFPPSFPLKSSTSNVNIQALLLLIGQLTTPPTTQGISLSEYWAYIRYLSAITNDSGLRLTEDFSKLDAHQKTILSDDFGMGIPMYWLKKRLNLKQIVDGRFFIDTVAASVGATATKTAKRGPNKSPDFVAIDGNGIWHVVECKGTQSGTGYRDTQLKGSQTNAGAIQQKLTIKFPSAHTGQRLACGVALATENDPQITSLKIIDPVTIEDPFVVRDDYLAAAQEAAKRSSVAIGLRLAGFHTASDAVASPVGPRPSSQSTRGRREERRQAFVRERREGALAEIENRAQQHVFDFGGKRYFGRELSLDFPKPIGTEDARFRGVRVRQGISAETLRTLRQENFPDQRTVDFNSLDDLGNAFMNIEEGDYSADLRVGEMFIASIELIRAR